MTRVLVTGGSGFIGSFVVERLLEGGHAPAVLDVRGPVWNPSVDTMLGSTALTTDVERAFKEFEPEAVIHLSALTGTTETFQHPQDTVQVNVIGTVNVLESCRVGGVRFVTAETATPWMSPYAITKRAATDFARGYHDSFHLPATILRVFNVYGPRQEAGGPFTKVVPRFVTSALRGEQIPVFGEGDQIVDLVDVQGCADALVRAVETAPGRAEVIEIGSGTRRTVREVAERVVSIAGRGRIEFLPPRIGEGDEHPVADVRSAKQILGWEPDVSLSNLAPTIAWYREHLNTIG